MTSPAPLPSSRRDPSRANWLGRYLEVEKRFDDRLKATLADALSHVDDAFDSVKENFSGKVRRQQYAAAKRSMRDVLSHVFGVTGENIRQSRSEAAIAAVDAELYEERGILSRIFSDPTDRKQYADSLRQTAARNVENVVARTLFSERPLSQQVWKTEALANNLVSQAVNRGIARGDTAKEIAQSVKHMVDPATPGGISYAARRLGTTEVNNAFHATAIKTAQDTPWVHQMQWHLSKRHEKDPGDECETYALQKLFDVEHVPEKPHPFCRCYVTPVQQDYEDFENALHSGQYDQHLDEVLGFEDESLSAREQVPQEWPEGTTDRVKAAYEKAKAQGKTDVYPDKSWTPAEKKAGQKLTVRLQNAALEAEQRATESAAAARSRRIIDDIVPNSIGEAENSKQVANYLTNRYEGLEVENFDYADVDTDAAKEIGEAFIERQAKNPRTNLRSLRIVDDLPVDVNAETRYNGKTGFSEVVFNHTTVSDYAATKRAAKKSTLLTDRERENGFTVGHLSAKARSNRPFYDTFVHEWGHVLDYSGGARVSRGIDPQIEIDRVYAATGKKPKVRAGKGLWERWLKVRYPDYDPQFDYIETTAEDVVAYEDWVFEGAPSGYSFRDQKRKKIHKDEIVAESYIEFMKNPNAHPMTKSVVQELFAAIKENKRLKVPVSLR